MKTHQRLVLSLVPLIVILTATNDVLASCPQVRPGPPCMEFWRADAVFIGVANRVVRETDNSPNAFGPYSRSTIYFTIEEAFKGVGGTALVLELDHCGHLFKENERYLVYAHRNSNSKALDVRLGNTRTRPVSEAKEDLDYIRGLSSAEPGARVFGKITQHTYNIKKHEIDVETLQKIRVTLEGNNERKEVLTDSEGNYEFRGVSAGTYRVQADLPAYLGGYAPEEEFKLTGRGCAPIDFRAWRKAQIAGRVLDVNGKPLVSVPVTLVSADATPEQILYENKDKTAWPFSITNREGRFNFSHLAPGRYLLIINRAEYEKARGKEWSALPRLFYPGVNDLAAATVIVVSDEAEPREYNFTLPLR
ncbi:MAG TPA: carboxypeptidase-like regulatory domain-containing protein [Pyrinomonadaceae bacterium]|nr:carboxypeptidase-like regulatory domain-containing protein [Pyrinomonadaceae bacterium]